MSGFFVCEAAVALASPCPGAVENASRHSATSARAHRPPHGTYRAPFNVHDVEHVALVPRSHLMQTAMH